MVFYLDSYVQPCLCLFIDVTLLHVIYNLATLLLLRLHLSSCTVSRSRCLSSSLALENCCFNLSPPTLDGCVHQAGQHTVSLSAVCSIYMSKRFISSPGGRPTWLCGPILQSPDFFLLLKYSRYYRTQRLMYASIIKKKTKQKKKILLGRIKV